MRSLWLVLVFIAGAFLLGACHPQYTPSQDGGQGSFAPGGMSPGAGAPSSSGEPFPDDASPDDDRDVADDPPQDCQEPCVDGKICVSGVCIIPEAEPPAPEGERPPAPPPAPGGGEPENPPAGGRVCRANAECGPGKICKNGVCVVGILSAAGRLDVGRADAGREGPGLVNAALLGNSGAPWIRSQWVQMPAVSPPQGCNAFRQTYIVSTGRNDDEDGSAEHPFRTIQHAVDRAGECSLIRIRPGTYRETVSIYDKKKIVLQGDDRQTTIIDAGTPINDWRSLLPAECPRGQRCDGIFKTTVGYGPGYLTVDGKSALMLTTPYQGHDLLDYLVAGPQKPIPNRGGYERKSWDGVEAVFLVKPLARDDSGRATRADVYLRARQMPEPGQVKVPRGTASAIDISNSSGITIRDMTMINGKYAVLVRRDSPDVVIEGNRLLGGHHVVYIFHDEGPQRPRDMEVRYNEISQHLAADTSPYGANASTIWHVVKGNGVGDKTGVNLYSAGDGISIHHNYFPDGWDGVQDAAKEEPPIGPTRCQNLTVAYNVMENMLDDCMEPTGGEINAHWHHNALKDCSIGLRTKFARAPDGGGIVEMTTGPIYIYGNVFNNRDDFGNFESAAGQRPPHTLYNMYIHSGTRAEAYIYHNTFLGWAGIVFGSTAPSLGAPNMWFLNNIISAKYISNQRFASWPWEISKKMPFFDFNWAGGLESSITTDRDPARLPRPFVDAVYWGDNNISAANGQRFWGAFPSFGGKRVQDFCPDDSAIRTGGMGLDISQPFSIPESRVENHVALPGIDYQDGPPYLGAFRPGDPACRTLP